MAKRVREGWKHKGEEKDNEIEKEGNTTGNVRDTEMKVGGEE